MKGNFKKGKSKNYKKGRSGRTTQTQGQRVAESLSETNDKLNMHDKRILNGDNDWQWYAVNQQLVKDTASYPFGKALGLPISDTSYFAGHRVPGLLAVHFLPSIGVAQEESSAINVAMRKLYSFVRHANSGSRNYEAPDLMLYVVATGSARMYLAYLKRVYGIMMNYTMFNRNYPRGLVEANGCDYNDLEANLNDFRGYINIYASKLNQLWVPTDFSFIKRQEWMCAHYYVDSQTSPKAQTYMYVPDGFYKFTVSGTPAVGSLVTEYITSHSSTFMMGLSEIIELGNALLTPLITNEEIGIMAGDILKAYGTSGCAPCTGITEDYRTLPEYSPEVASQFENATIFTEHVGGSFNVTQDTTIGGGYLKSNPKILIGARTAIPVEPASQNRQNVVDALAAPLKGKILNFHHVDPSPEEVMVATRMAAVASNDATYVYTSGKQIYAQCPLRACGTEVAVRARIWTISSSGAPARYTDISTAYWSVAQINVTNPSWAISAINSLTTYAVMLSNFDWHFGSAINTMLYTADGEFTWTTCDLPLQDMDYWTELDGNNLENMHNVALLSEFSVPMVG